jgi:hypothetical protein
MSSDDDIASVLSSTSLRRAQLQARCEEQRNELSDQVADIEQRLHGTDVVLGKIRNVFTKPSVVAGGLALLMGVNRSGWWSKLSKAAVLFGTARRVYQTFKRK